MSLPVNISKCMSTAHLALLYACIIACDIFSAPNLCQQSGSLTFSSTMKMSITTLPPMGKTMQVHVLSILSECDVDALITLPCMVSIEGPCTNKIWV